MDERLFELTDFAVSRHEPTLVLLSVPFPGAMYASLRIAQRIQKRWPEISIAMGGGYINTELRELTDPRLFDFVDFISLDSGERPLLAIIDQLKGNRSLERLVRTFVRNTRNEVRLMSWPELDVPFEEVGTATWDGLPLNSYLSLLDMLNPCLLYTSPSPRDRQKSRMPSSA